MRKNQTRRDRKLIMMAKLLKGRLRKEHLIAKRKNLILLTLKEIC